MLPEVLWRWARSRRGHFGGGLLALVAVTSVAQDSEPVLRTLPPEPAPPPTEDEQADEQPKVTIAPRRGGEIQEYRVNGQLRAIRITPSRGPAYYLLDTDGDGLLETRSFELADDIRIPGWVIFRW